MPRWTAADLRAYEDRRNAADANKAIAEPIQIKFRSDKGTKRPRHFQNCQQCGKEFHAPFAFKRKFCSLDCAYLSPERNVQKPKDRGMHVCEKCGEEFRLLTGHGLGRFCSQQCACATNSYARSSWVVIGEKHFYARSRWEANYGRYLEWKRERGLIVQWDHEPDTFWFVDIKRGVRSYLPDYRVLNLDGSLEYHEVKGWMDKRSVTKLRRMKKYHPKVKIVLIDSARYQSLRKSVSAIVPGWEAGK